MDHNDGFDCVSRPVRYRSGIERTCRSNIRIQRAALAQTGSRPGMAANGAGGTRAAANAIAAGHRAARAGRAEDKRHGISNFGDGPSGTGERKDGCTRAASGAGKAARPTAESLKGGMRREEGRPSAAAAVSRSSSVPDRPSTQAAHPGSNLGARSANFLLVTGVMDGNDEELWGQEFPKWSVTPSDRGFSVRGERTEGVGHKPDALRTLSEPPGDSGAVPEGAVAAHLPREWRATCTAPAAPGHGTADWIAVPLQFFYAPRSQRCF